MVRKPPRRHKVKQHARHIKKGLSVRVREHFRGRGVGSSKKKILKKEIPELRQYTVALTYSDGKTETVTPVAHSTIEALINAKQMRKRKDRPVKAVVKNSELIDVMREISTKGPAIAMTAAEAIALAGGKEIPPKEE